MVAGQLDCRRLPDYAGRLHSASGLVLAVANFIHLAGKDEDVLETAIGVPEVGRFGHDRQLYRPTAGSDVQRLPLTVALVPETPNFRAYYGIYQNQTLIGGVETTAAGILF